MKWLVVLILLAGCAEPTVEDTLAGPETGAVSGVVTDGSLRPVVAEVTLTTPLTKINATTDEEGRFEFPQLEPGSYQVSAQAEGFKLALESVAVHANEVTTVTLVMQWDPTFVTPFHQGPFVFDGFIECSAVATTPANPAAGPQHAAVAVCGAPNSLGFQLGQDRFMHVLDSSVQPTFVQMELTWKPTQDASKSLLFEALQADKFCEDASGCLGLFDSTSGEGPLILRIDSSYLGSIGSTHDLALRVLAFTQDPAPAGAVLQQSFQVYTTLFYGYEPSANWSFLEAEEVPKP